MTSDTEAHPSDESHLFPDAWTLTVEMPGDIDSISVHIARTQNALEVLAAAIQASPLEDGVPLEPFHIERVTPDDEANETLKRLVQLAEQVDDGDTLRVRRE